MYRYNATLDRIVDGDTVDVYIDLGFDIHIKQRVRLYGINTPETRTRDLEEKKRGFAAKAYLEEILPEKFVIETVYDKKGKYGRVLGILWNDIDDVNVNEKMIDEGHAERY
jgi:micrococcal nuclease